MQQLTIKHLGRRLAYGLKFKGEQGTMIYTLTNLDFKHNSKNLYSDEFGNECVLFNTKPVLRNLSDLTKEIEHNGEKFVPIQRINEHHMPHAHYMGWALEADSLNQVGLRTPESWMPFIKYMPLFEFLLEHHFHLDEPEGTWIDINSLPENPYK